MKSLEKIGKYIRKKRLEAGVSQAELAEILEYSSPQFISNWERGLAAPPWNKGLKLCKTIKANPKELFELLKEETIRHHKRAFFNEL